MAERKRILLLHHDEDSLITLQWILENQGFDTTCTWDHAEAARLGGRATARALFRLGKPAIMKEKSPDSLGGGTLP